MDYNELYKSTVKDKFPILIIEELLDELTGSAIYSILGLRFRYLQAKMH